MKKLIALLLVASIGLAVVGCKGSSTDDSSSSAAATPKLKDKTPKMGDE